MDHRAIDEVTLVGDDGVIGRLEVLGFFCPYDLRLVPVKTGADLFTLVLLYPFHFLFRVRTILCPRSGVKLGEGTLALFDHLCSDGRLRTRVSLELETDDGGWDTSLVVVDDGGCVGWVHTANGTTGPSSHIPRVFPPL